jgi:hypothetical protein
MKKIGLFLFLVILSSWLPLNMASACDRMAKNEKKAIKAHHSCCKKKGVKKSENNNHQNKNEKHNCGGGCQNSNCHCIHFLSNSIIPTLVSWKSETTFQQYSQLIVTTITSKISPGFYYIWQPPNIG